MTQAEANRFRQCLCFKAIVISKIRVYERVLSHDFTITVSSSRLDDVILVELLVPTRRNRINCTHYKPLWFRVYIGNLCSWGKVFNFIALKHTSLYCAKPTEHRATICWASEKFVAHNQNAASSAKAIIWISCSLMNSFNCWVWFILHIRTILGAHGILSKVICLSCLRGI